MARRPYISLARLAELTHDELTLEWGRRFETPAPNIAPDLLRLGIGYKLQEAKSGGPDRSTRRLLRQVVAGGGEGASKQPLPRKLAPGTRLVRDWHGVGYTVTVLEEGFEYDGKHWPSLTAIARAITGCHRSGNAFFGLAGPKR
jgi:hypothetical protein